MEIRKGGKQGREENKRGKGGGGQEDREGRKEGGKGLIVGEDLSQKQKAVASKPIKLKYDYLFSIQFTRVPDCYDEVYQKMTWQGARVLALGYKSLGELQAKDASVQSFTISVYR